MEQIGRRSLLQTEILAQLRNEPIASVSALAGKLDKSRPAVSRALKTLSDQGLAQRSGRTWSLTDPGVAAAESALAKLQQSAADVIEVAGQRFRAMNRAGVGGAHAATILASDLVRAAAEMDEQRAMPSLTKQMIEAMNERFDAVHAISSVGLVQQESAQNFARELSSAFTPADFGLAVRGIESLSGAFQEAAGLSIVQDASRELLTSLGSDQAVKAARSFERLLTPMAPGNLVLELGSSLAERMAESFGAALGDTTAVTPLLGEDFSALSKSVGAITALNDEWPRNFVEAATTLAKWEEQFAESISAYSAASATQFGDILSGLARVDLPEPLLSDALRVYGLNSERIHTPTYWISPVVPVEDVEGAERRAAAARHRRIVDAMDTLIAMEVSIRTLIATKLNRHHGPSWWKRSIPPKIRQDCEDRKRNREVAGGLRHSLIDYTYTSELKDILLKGDNWNSVFSSIFRSKAQVEAVFLWIEPVRKDIAHSRLSSDRDYKQFKFAVTWLLDAVDDALDGKTEIHDYD